MRLAVLLAALAAAHLTPVDESGYRKLLASQRGKVVLVDFWATWCDPCREELPRLIALEARLRSRGFVLVTISADEPEQEAAADAFLKQQNAPRPAYRKNAKSDEDFINFVDRRWSGALPALFLYDRAGKRVQSFIGETETSDIEAAVSGLL